MNKFQTPQLSYLDKLCTGITKKQLESSIENPLDIELELLKASGLEVLCKEDKYFLNTAVESFNDTTFCVVDIETNGSKPSKHQVIEIGAVLVKDFSVIDSFESLVHCNDISQQITEITGITVNDTKNAPMLREVMQEFKHFLGSSVFVAHAVRFDFFFIHSMLEKFNLGPLYNRKLCTIDLAERTVASSRYGLAFLNEELNLYKHAKHHRAYSDAMTAAKLFKHTLKCLPDTIKTTEELIHFSKKAKRIKYKGEKR